MNGRAGFWLLAPLLALALLAQTKRATERLQASKELHTVEVMTLQAARVGNRGDALLRLNLGVLRRAAEHDPTEVGIPMAIGSQYLLLGKAPEAIASYQAALALEPRPETYLSLGKAQLLAGDLDAARASFDSAVALDPRYRKLVPPLPERGG
jgi:tetratricopeptide (TPR) repeat protein